MKKRKITAGLFLCAAFLAGCSQTEDQARAVSSYAYVEEQADYVLENESLKLVLDPATTYVTVTDKKSNTVWTSNPADAANDPRADGENKDQLLSTLLVEYGSSYGVGATLNNFSFSIENGLYEIEKTQDAIKVRYTVGNVEKSFMIPAALPESVMDGYLEQMDSSGAKQIREYYRKYDINKLRSADDKNELLALYPELAEECVYVLRDNLQDYLKKRMETSFEEAGYTAENYQEDRERYAKASQKEIPAFNVTVVYRLDGKELVVEVPMEELAWSKTYPMTKLTLLPYMGAGSEAEDGYLLVPEGPGALMRFNNGKTKQNSYYANVYGWNLAQYRKAVVDESRTAYGVFAIAKEDASMLCVLEDKRADATIEADISGKRNSYNFAYASYRILHGESLDVSAKSDQSVVVFENGLLQGSICQRYYFLESDDYADLAAVYREHLTRQDPQLVKDKQEKMPVMVTAVGAIDKIQQKFGFPMSVPVALTTYSEAKQMLEDMDRRGYEEIYVRYEGWMNDGVTHTYPKKVSTIPELGSKKELQETIAFANDNGIRLYLDGMALQAYRSGVADGFFVNRDSARYASREVAEIARYSPIWYGEEADEQSHHLLKPQVSLQMMDSLANAAAGFSAGVSYRDVGYLLGADYSQKNHVSRQRVAEMEREKLGQIKDSGQGILLPYGNDYAVAYADAILDMDLTGKQYAVLDGFVPFYPMALHGLVPYAGTSVNLSGDYTQAVLESAEMGACLSFTFMMESAATLQESSYTRYFGSDYALWADTAAKVAGRYQKELGGCFGQAITGHKTLAEGVSVTEYADKTKVYVNYNETEYRGIGVIVPARDYLVTGGGK